MLFCMIFRRANHYTTAAPHYINIMLRTFVSFILNYAFSFARSVVTNEIDRVYCLFNFFVRLYTLFVRQYLLFVRQNPSKFFFFFLLCGPPKAFSVPEIFIFCANVHTFCAVSPDFCATKHLFRTFYVYLYYRIFKVHELTKIKNTF